MAILIVSLVGIIVSMLTMRARNMVIEGASKYLGTRICVSEAAVSRVPGFRGRPVGTLWLQGKKQRIGVFEPLADTDYDRSVLKDYLEVYELLRAKRPGALAGLTEHYRRHPKDTLAGFYLDRLRSGQAGIQIELKSK